MMPIQGPKLQPADCKCTKKLSVGDQNSRASHQQATNHLTFQCFESAFRELIWEENFWALSRSCLSFVLSMFFIHPGKLVRFPFSTVVICALLLKLFERHVFQRFHLEDVPFGMLLKHMLSVATKLHSEICCSWCSASL